MGYYSDVALALKKKNYDEMVEQAKRASNKNILDFITKECDVRIPILDDSQNNEYVVLYWDYIKWYEDFEEIIFINSFLNNEEEEIPYKLIRLGEEDDDNEIKEGGCDDILCNLIYPYRNIDFNFKFKEK